jgi:hypothetical protein
MKHLIGNAVHPGKNDETVAGRTPEGASSLATGVLVFSQRFVFKYEVV